MNVLGSLMPGLDVRLAKTLAEVLVAPGEGEVDDLWSSAVGAEQELLARPAKRLRPMLLLLGHGLWGVWPSPQILRCAAALEILHAFMLVHDDVADRAPARRGGRSLHRILGEGHAGEALAVVVGDHLFARAIEVLLSSGHPLAAEAAAYLLRVCRETAAGQYLDLSLSGKSLADTRLNQTLKVAELKTARYGFSAPLAMGGILAGAGKEEVRLLERIGRHLGLAFQLTDDLAGLFGSSGWGKAGDADFFESKRTFPVVAAYVRADGEGRAELEHLWSTGHKDVSGLVLARTLVERHGGRHATFRAISRSLSAARKAMQGLPVSRARTTLFEVAQWLGTEGAKRT